MARDMRWDYKKYKSIALALLAQCKRENLTLSETDYVFSIAMDLITQSLHRAPLGDLDILHQK